MENPTSSSSRVRTRTQVVWQGSVGDHRPYADLVGNPEIISYVSAYAGKPLCPLGNLAAFDLFVNLATRSEFALTVGPLLRHALAQVWDFLSSGLGL
jgi:hypothetical protein